MPAVSRRQFRAMQAAKHGNSTLGIPASVGAEYVAATGSTKGLPERARVQGATLGMTVKPPKKTPYDKLGRRMEAGMREQAQLEGRGEQLLGTTGAGARRTQKRIPATGLRDVMAAQRSRGRT